MGEPEPSRTAVSHATWAANFMMRSIRTRFSTNASRFIAAMSRSKSEQSFTASRKSLLSFATASKAPLRRAFSACCAASRAPAAYSRFAAQFQSHCSTDRSRLCARQSGHLLAQRNCEDRHATSKYFHCGLCMKTCRSNSLARAARPATMLAPRPILPLRPRYRHAHARVARRLPAAPACSRQCETSSLLSRCATQRVRHSDFDGNRSIAQFGSGLGNFRLILRERVFAFAQRCAFRLGPVLGGAKLIL